MEFVVSEDTEVVLDGQKYLLEKGDTIVLEKWEGDAEIEHTGEHASKSVAQLRKEVASLKKKQASNEKTDPNITKEIRERDFAIRAKTGWKKGENATK